MDAAEIIIKFTDFFEEYYYDKLIDNIRKGHNYLIIDYRKLSKHNIELAELLIDNPDTSLKAASDAILNFEKIKAEYFYIRLKDTPKSITIPIRNILKRKYG